MIYLLVVFLWFIPSLSFAAYQNPQIVAKNVLPNGFIQLDLIFSGNAGEPSVRRTYTLTPSTTATIVRNWVDDQIRDLDALFTASSIPAIQLGQTIPRLTPVAPTPSPKDVWNLKLDKYMRVKDSGIAAIASDLATLKADLEATYQAGFIN